MQAKKQKISIRLPLDVLQGLKEIGCISGLNMSQIIREILKDYIKTFYANQKNEKTFNERGA